jgi:glutathionylspermidine synthase
MKRVLGVPRPNWAHRVEEQGLSYHTHTRAGVPVAYWFEGAYYEFSMVEIDRIEQVTNDLHEMCIKAAERIIEKGWITTRLALPESAVSLIQASWERDEKSLYGRIDLSYNPSLSEQPKFLEYNGDTPTGFLEAAVIQWFWLTDRFQAELQRKEVDQFNSIHESLIGTWKSTGLTKVHFTGCTDVPEDHQTLLYLADTASQAGKQVELIDITRIGWNASARRFWGETDPLDAVFKLYPWEDLFLEEFGKYLGVSPTIWIEPAWKILIANKALLPILWEMYPEHPNLLPAYDQPGRLKDSFSKKALYSREGANMVLRHGGKELSTGAGTPTDRLFIKPTMRCPTLTGTCRSLGPGSSITKRTGWGFANQILKSRTISVDSFHTLFGTEGRERLLKKSTEFREGAERASRSEKHAANEMLDGAHLPAVRRIPSWILNFLLFNRD